MGVKGIYQGTFQNHILCIFHVLQDGCVYIHIQRCIYTYIYTHIYTYGCVYGSGPACALHQNRARAHHGVWSLTVLSMRSPDFPRRTTPTPKVLAGFPSYQPAKLLLPLESRYPWPLCTRPDPGALSMHSLSCSLKL